ncbi:unnamed protein product [Parnassius mnemosyne]|uniref:E3 ubiquitin-protein ligase PPP1R11 n=1 Tax=Parnassius mnemosyne TaxID=213953 RepID=A0AAV1M7D9_9NEOP
MNERQRTLRLRPEDMATTSTAVTTASSQIPEAPVEPVAVITLRPNRTQTRKKVVWTEDTVDNENMNKKKSKCCCIYEKPRRFGESESESSDDECEHCFGHVEQRRQKRQAGETTTELQVASERTAEVTLKTTEDRPSSPAPSTPPTPPAPPAS